MQENREYKRLTKAIKLKYKIIYSLGFGSNLTDGEGVTHSINVSEGGLLFISKTMIPVDSFLEVELNLPGEEFTIYLKGKILHVKEIEEKYELGIQFDYKFDKDSEILHHYVIKHSETS